MQVIKARNVNEAFRLGMLYLNNHGVARDSRGGDVLEYPTAVSTVYAYPDERVITIRTRDANPFFHFFEALWMLSGADDVEFLSQFNSNIAGYSDDGNYFHGAYGYRWRKLFGFDQLDKIVDLLFTTPETRRAVLSLWSPKVDLGTDSLDIPCNDTIFFKIRDELLHMTVCCRSNDAIWGTYGANAVHMSMLQEYIASRVGVKLGTYTQISDSLHIYLDNPQWEALRKTDVGGFCPYKDGDIVPYPMMQDRVYWDRDLKELMQWIRSAKTMGDDFEGAPDYPYANEFFSNVAVPMFVTWKLHKDKAPHGGLAAVGEIKAEDWQLACRDWLTRREQ